MLNLEAIEHCQNDKFRHEIELLQRVHASIDGEYAGHIVIADALKKQAQDAIATLKRAGVQKIVLLTGDSSSSGEEVARTLGINEVFCSLLPTDKVQKVETFLNNKSVKEKLVFIGDGINDAPVLSVADVGVMIVCVLNAVRAMFVTK